MDESLIAARRSGVGGDPGSPYDKTYFSPTELLTSKFVVLQTIFNVVVSFCGPLFFFWLIFHVLSGKDCFPILSGEVLGPVLASPLAAAVLALAWAPLGMMDALPRGWFGYVAEEEFQGGMWFLLPSLRISRIGVLRNLVTGLQLSVVAIPIMMLFVLFVFASDGGDVESSGLNSDGYTCEGKYLTPWTQTLASVTYIALLPLFVIPVGLLGYAVEPNLDRVTSILDGKGFIAKGIYSPIC